MAQRLDYTAYAVLYYYNTDFNYPISKMCCPIMSVIFGKVLYLIPIKMPPKRYGKFRGYHAYLWLALCSKNFREMNL